MDRKGSTEPDSADSNRPRKRRRWWRRLLFLSAVVAVVTSAVALLTLRTAPGRKAVLGWASKTIEERVGFSIIAASHALGTEESVLGAPADVASA